MNTKVEISIILLANNGREVNIHDLAIGSNYFDEEITSEFLWGTLGGIEITIDGYKSILKCFEFYVSLNAIDFLMNSVFWNYGFLDKGYVDEEFPDCITSRLYTGNILKMCMKDEETVSLSYEQTDSSSVDSRRFFDKEIFHRSTWIEAVYSALKDYFELLDKTLIEHSLDTTSKIMGNYLDQWKELKKVANKTQPAFH